MSSSGTYHWMQPLSQKDLQSKEDQNRKCYGPPGIQLPEMFELWIIPSSGLAFCCLLFILLRYFILASNETRRFDLEKSCSVSLSPEMENWTRLAHWAEPSGSRAGVAGAGKPCGRKESPTRSIQCSKIPEGSCHASVLWCCSVVMKSKKKYFCLFHFQMMLRCSCRWIYILKICALGDNLV